ncbi:sulfatase-like hydrolase/transferase [Pacificoceanicola onchidii]|uniref:sulfatase-like hydrolase/transferase n=1 Tax=Pacificoceanicola onchidii TaxID=2562685 RepID=UPI0010A54983|nr:sulfatase-like hydrolase/transferase [Pacificoceanicola onchidii]
MKKPSNLLVILSDQHQAHAMSCAGHAVAKTPHLDALAARGTRFTNAYTPSPICVPARAAFATGQYSHQVRLWDNAMPYTGTPRGWGHALQDKGVRVESIGKLHYRTIEDDAGFDVQHIPMHVHDGVGMVWGSIRKEDERVYHKEVRMMGDYVGPGDSSYTRYDKAVTDRTCDWLSDAAGDQEPWCLYVGLVAPHHPLVAPQEFYDLYPLDSLPPDKLSPKDGYEQHPWIKKLAFAMVGEDGWKDAHERRQAIAAYYGLTSYMDHNVGRIVAALKASGQYEDTTIIYSSDHGENLGVRGLWGKMNMYEESASIPLIVAPAPNAEVRPRAQCATTASLLDVSETILDHFDADLPGQRPGQSLYALAASQDNPERAVFSEYHAVGAVSGAFMLRKGRWKLIEYVGYAPELFDLEADPEETTNLAGHPEQAAVLAALQGEMRRICDPETVDAMAFADQEKMIENYGGKNIAATLGAPSATPPPKTD